MKYHFQVKRYKRTFKKPLITSHFILKERQGFIIRLQDENERVGFGEIAPFEYFGSESMEQAKTFCNQLGTTIEDDLIDSINPQMPCTRFAFESAKEMMQSNQEVHRKFEVAALISLTENLDLFKGYRNFKCKIGLDFRKEKESFLRLIEKLPPGSNLRLDANGALTKEIAQKWLTLLEHSNVQFLEQPLPKGQETLMQEIGKDYRTPIALDESIVGFEACEQILASGWNQWIVVKPSLIGNTVRFKTLRTQYKVQVVYSSIFETGIGNQAVLRTAASDDRNNYAIGLGTNAYFNEDGFNLHNYTNGPVINYEENTQTELERIWALCQYL